jgi:TM2 domain-containing membrane protein YozV
MGVLMLYFSILGIFLINVVSRYISFLLENIDKIEKIFSYESIVRISTF